MSMLLFLQYALWSIIGDSGFVVSSLVSSASAFLPFHLLTGKMGTRPGFAFFPKGQRQTITNWQTIGKINFNDGVASYNGDFVLHFRHPTWRHDRNDPSTAVRQHGKKVRWF
jgi:hypothetical protein